MDFFEVSISRQAEKQLEKVPMYIVVKLQAWVVAVRDNGLMATRKIPGFHDEPLKGKRKGQRSIRLSKAYRAIYAINADNVPQIIDILEVTKHEY